MKLEVLKHTGESTGRNIELPSEIFGIEPNDHAIYLDVKQHQAKKRQGTHKTKERSDVAGSTKKLKKQKGTGTARFGDIKNPLFRGGGTIFGPRPRAYDFKLNKKLKALARKSALSYKAKENSVTVLEDFTFETPKTKEYRKMLEGLSLVDNKTLLVTTENNDNLFLSGRNIANTEVMPLDHMNTYAILKADKLVLCESAVAKLKESFSKES
jgi:large subunit ribosomal protein L4